MDIFDIKGKIIIGLIILWLLTLGLAAWQGFTIKDERYEKMQYKNALDYQNNQLLQNKKEADEKLKDLPKKIAVLERELKDKENEIEQWRKSHENATCEESLDRLNHIIF